ncbi:M3 family metallopeptidase [Saccharicrinis sp. FJH54]|uniref:M3 family metallopeptidase n=1 Tax=Saccharicrinis sp. FJH54 TaxID=3344665 RepID=UPI0035D49D3F
MKNLVLISTLIVIIMTACNSGEKGNPFFETWNTPYGTPPFSRIENSDYMPAVEAGIKQEEEEINAIVNNTEAPSFENTIVALDKTGHLLKKVTGVFYNLSSANTSDELQEIAKELSPVLSRHNTNISLNPELFARIKAVYDKKDELQLNTEQEMLLEKTYDGFVRGGANLSDDKKQRLREINEQMSMLTLEFGNNILAETNNFELLIENEADLAGLPESVIAGAAAKAKEKGYTNKWVFTPHKPSMIPFITYSEKRDLRKQLFNAYISRGNHDNDKDNKEIIKKIVALRIERANMFGFRNHAEYILDKNMAKTPEKVYDLILKVWNAALPVAREEVKDMQAIIDKEGGNFKLEPWDWWYYAEKVKAEKYALNENELMPYFEVNNVRNGIFKVAEKLYGLQFKERNDIEVYHPDVVPFEVLDADGNHVGIIYTDYFVRSGKRAGAWMNSYRKQERINGEMITPVVCNVCNFPAPSENMPALLTWDNVQTMFHEFGHALHGLLSQCSYYTLSGTAVPRDFVELPSQIMENWAGEPEVLKLYAYHYKTGELIPEELIEKINKASHFNQGFATVEYVSAALLDMDWHTLTEVPEDGVNEFETKTLNKYGMIPEIVVRYRSPYFAHIFSGGYSAGYYAYMWAELLDADAFNTFRQNGIFDQETASKFKRFVLSKGGTDDPMKLYVQFRGQEPDPDALLLRRGLKTKI